MPPVFPLAVFGSVNYMRKLVEFGDCIFEKHEHFPKQTIRNRYTILGPNGEQRLTIPIIKKNGSKTPTKDVQIDHNSSWLIQHERALKTAYSASPFFEHYWFDLNEIFIKKHVFLIDFNLDVLDFFISEFQLPIDYKTTEEYNFSPDFDFRNADFNFLTNGSSIFPVYKTVFESKIDNINNVSFLDVIFNEGPMAKGFVQLLK